MHRTSRSTKQSSKDVSNLPRGSSKSKQAKQKNTTHTAHTTRTKHQDSTGTLVSARVETKSTE